MGGEFLLLFLGILIASLWVAGICNKLFGTRVHKNGYVLRNINNRYEHRYIAEQVLGRRLTTEEVVHHINGRPADNAPSNLCVLSEEAHNEFHAWLRYKKEMEGRYPSYRYQRIVLQERYEGVLLGGREPVPS